MGFNFGNILLKSLLFFDVVTSFFRELVDRPFVKGSVDSSVIPI